MDTIKFGLILSIIPFTVIFLVVTMWWALVDMSLGRVSGTKRVVWTLVTIFFPPFGAIAYNFMVKNRQQKEEFKHQTA